MKKINQTIYRKLTAQAEEAKNRGLVKLAQDITEALKDTDFQVAPEEYSYAELKKDMESDLWKSAVKLISYYNINSIDAEKVEKAISILAVQVMYGLESSMKVDPADPGSLEPKVPGENK